MDCIIVEKKAMLFEGCLVKCEGGNAWAKWEKWDSMESDNPKYAHHHQVDDYPNESRAFEVRFYPKDAEYCFTGLEVTREEPDVIWEYIKIPVATYAIFDIDQKVNTKPQFQAVDNWLEENKDKYKQMKWDADGKVDLSNFVICLYDHRGKFQKDNIMEMWIPLIKVTE